MTEPATIRECVADVLVNRGIAGRIVVHFDGSCEPTNPGGVATCGWLIHDDSGNLIASGSCEVCRGEGATNNVAEWSALGFALRYLADKQIGCGQVLEIYGDSQLVVKQLSLEWVCNAQNLRPLMRRCLELLEQIKASSWLAKWIPREQNSEADALSRQAYETATGKSYPERSRHVSKR